MYAIFLAVRIATYIFPLRNNKFFCIAMTGNSYGDSIKCLSDYIAVHHPNPIIVWAFSQSFYNKVNCSHIKVRMYSFKYYYHILTAKYILTNVSLEKKMFVKRRGQICVQTWHGTALKRIGVDMYRKKTSFFNRVTGGSTTEYTAHLTDIVVSGSRFMTDVLHNKCLYPLNIIHEIGTPRNDVFFHDNDNIRSKICHFYGINETEKIILYAPTFRKGGSMDFYNVELDRIRMQFEQLQGGHFVVMVRLHPNLLKKETTFLTLFPPNTINVSSYPDMIDLLYSADVLVTDYSSCMFDFMYTFRPVILYVPDRATYNRGFYMDIESLPFIIVNENFEIEEKLSSLNLSLYQKNVRRFLKEIGSCEQGIATQRVYNMLMLQKKN